MLKDNFGILGDAIAPIAITPAALALIAQARRNRTRRNRTQPRTEPQRDPDSQEAREVFACACQACGEAWISEDQPAACPICGSPGIRIKLAE